MHAAIATLLLVVGQCEACGDKGCAGGACGADGLTFCQRWFCGPMPQTCYQPAYGCYPGNPRTIQRYPAFHGTYYRNPYNWRNEFDYPWHAEPHEPTSMFSYHVEGEGETIDAAPAEMIIEDDVEVVDPPPQLPGAEFEESNPPRLNRLPQSKTRHAARPAPNRAARAIRPADGASSRLSRTR